MLLYLWFVWFGAVFLICLFGFRVLWFAYWLFVVLWIVAVDFGCYNCLFVLLFWVLFGIVVCCGLVIFVCCLRIFCIVVIGFICIILCCRLCCLTLVDCLCLELLCLLIWIRCFSLLLCCCVVELVVWLVGFL